MLRQMRLDRLYHGPSRQLEGEYMTESFLYGLNLLEQHMSHLYKLIIGCVLGFLVRASVFCRLEGGSVPFGFVVAGK